MGVVLEVPVWDSSLSLSQGSLRQRGPADPFVAAMKRAGSRQDRLVLAIRALGETLAEAGDDEAANECFDRLRVLDPGDTLQAQAARMRLHAPTAPGMLP